MRLTRRGRFVVGALLVLLMWAWLIGAFVVGQNWKADRLESGSAPQVACQEDEPCWNCETMGNGVCGP